MENSSRMPTGSWWKNANFLNMYEPEEGGVGGGGGGEGEGGGARGKGGGRGGNDGPVPPANCSQKMERITWGPGPQNPIRQGHPKWYMDGSQGGRALKILYDYRAPKMVYGSQKGRPLKIL